MQNLLEKLECFHSASGVSEQYSQVIFSYVLPVKHTDNR